MPDACGAGARWAPASPGRWRGRCRRRRRASGGITGAGIQHATDRLQVFGGIGGVDQGSVGFPFLALVLDDDRAGFGGSAVLLLLVADAG